MRHYGWLLPVLVLGLSACVKDEPPAPGGGTVNLSSEHKIFVVNEGNFQWGNASLSFYDESSNAIVEDFYHQQNGQNLGDVGQSLLRYQNRYYAVVNNSGKVEVLNAETFVKSATISNLTSPRYLLPVSPQKAYISDLYANAISVVDLNTATKTGSIACPGWTEQMVLLYNRAFVTNLQKDYLYVVNTLADTLLDSVLVGRNAGSVVIDKYAKLWVLGQGQSPSPPQLLCINPITLQVEKTFLFSASDSPSHLVVSGNRDTLYYLNNGVYQYPVDAAALPAVPVVAQGSKLFYGLGINPVNGHIFVSDAIDYVQKSKVYVHAPNGTLLTSFNAGVNASGFWFE